MSSTQETGAALQLLKQRGPFELVQQSKATPGDDEVLVNVKVIALNPVDWKRMDYGFGVTSWPVVLGAEGAGVVAAVGKNLEKLWKVGDEVMGGSPGYYQEYVAVPPTTITRKPNSTSFEDAASIPMGYLTAAGAVHVGLGIPFPFIPGSQSEPNNKPHSVLVLGGSSAVGSAAVQLLRLTLPKSSIILTTCSSKHHSRAKDLGATHAFDQKTPSILSEIRSATPDNVGVEAILDAVDGLASQPELLQLLTGPKLLSVVPTGQDGHLKDLPADVKYMPAGVFAMQSAPGGANALGALTGLVEEGKYKVPLSVDVLEGGFGGIEGGLERLRGGVSGVKLVVPV